MHSRGDLAVPKLYPLKSKHFIQIQNNPGVVTCMDNRPHGLQTGHSVIFREVHGMVELNRTVQQVTGIVSPVLNSSGV